MTERARTILDSVIYGTVATASEDNTPWAAPQFMVYDADSKAIYWCAARASQHAQNIFANNKAFIVVYDSSAKPGEGHGVYLQTKVHEVTDPKEMANTMEKLIKRHQGVPYWALSDVQKQDAKVAIFKAKIQQSWVNEGGEEDGQFVLYRKSIEL